MKINSKRSIIAVVVVLIVLLIAAGGVYGYQRFYTRSSVTDGQTPSNLKCFDSASYFAIQRNLEGTVGSDVVVKYKFTKKQTFPCTYSVARNDFEVKNQNVEYFMLFTDNFLVLDSGTGPEPRQLVAYDLKSRKQVFTDWYSNPLTAEMDTLTYWSPVETEATVATCSNIAEITAQGLTPIIEQKVKVNLATLEKTPSEETQCVAKQ